MSIFSEKRINLYFPPFQLLRMVLKLLFSVNPLKNMKNVAADPTFSCQCWIVRPITIVHHGLDLFTMSTAAPKRHQPPPHNLF